MNQSRIHTKLIKAWADGAEIQVNHYSKWIDIQNPSWYTTAEYRIKPPKKTPGQIFFEKYSGNFCWDRVSQKEYEIGAKAVIEAYKQGMFNENCNC